MKNLSLVIKGFFIGIGKIIPGVSGSLIAITLGVYDRLLDIVSHFFKDIKENIKFLMPIGIGIISAIMLTSKILFILLDKYYAIMMLFFIGLILGGIPSQIKRINLSLNKNIIFTIISFFVILSISFINQNNSSEVHNYSFITFFLIGILDAATMIIPGISGTAIMMLLGCYTTVLNLFANIYLISNLKQTIFFFLGIGIGIIIVSKLISYCFKKYNEQTNYSIIGFTLSSVILLIINIFKVNINFINYFIGLILLTIGYIISYVLEKK